MQADHHSELNYTAFSNIDDLKKQYLLKRQRLIEEDRSTRFSSDILLNEQEKKADQVLTKLRDEIKNPTFDPVVLPFHQSKVIMENSQLYKALEGMPKGGVLHLHLTASVGVDFLIDVISYEDHLWINSAEDTITYSQVPIEGFQLLKDHRAAHPDVKAFDQKLKNLLVLNKDDVEHRQSQIVWQKFEPKFIITNDLYYFRDFFKKCLFQSMKVMVEQNVQVVEYRHIFGLMFDETKKYLSVEEEIAHISEVYQAFKKTHPLFEMKIISCGLKFLGKDSIAKCVTSTIKAVEAHPNLVTGFDLVNEEDTTEPTLFFLDELLKIKMIEIENPEMKVNLYLHGGESNSSTNYNLYDLLLLGVKRIGHGFAVINHPKLLDMVKEQNILLEISPLSNYALGYTLDLRSHPARSLITKGVQISISSDDPSFFGYDGVTLDFAFAFVAWELDLADLKKLSMNGIEYSALSSDEKSRVYEEFHSRWNKFIEQILQSDGQDTDSISTTNTIEL